MKEVDYTDDYGRRWRVRVPDDCPADRYHEGIPVGPPALDSLGLPVDVEIRLHNELHGRKLFILRDVQRNPQLVTGALQAAYRLDLQRLQVLYKEQGA